MMTGYRADREEKKGEKKMSVKQLGKKRNQNKTLALLAVLNCDILKIEAWDNVFSWFMTDKSQLSEIIL